MFQNKPIKHFCAPLLYTTTEYPYVKRNYFVKSHTVALHSFKNLSTVILFVLFQHKVITFYIRRLFRDHPMFNPITTGCFKSSFRS